MKAIIFDLDNTLIEWKDDFIRGLKKSLLNIKYNISDNEIEKINYCIDIYEKYNTKLRKEEFLDFVNKKVGINLPIEWVDELIVEQKELFYEDKEVDEVLNYLAKKYDLYVVTNWFTETQKGRLANMGILKYFKNVYGADINYYKPDKRSFDVVIKNYGVENCISVGDTLENDYNLPISLGMKAYLLSKKDIDGINTIKCLKDLKELL